MSKPNKTNKDHYTQRGRLTPDDMARERQKQAEISARAKGKERVTAKTQPNAVGAEAPARNRSERTPRLGGRASSRARSGSEE
jgi:hypothetical protein